MPKTYTTVPTVNPGDAILASSYNTYQKENVNNLIVPPLVQARRVANQSISHNTNTDISFDTEDYDTDAIFAPTSATFSVTTTGIWLINCSAVFATTVDVRMDLFLQIDSIERDRDTRYGTVDRTRISWAGYIATGSSFKITAYNNNTATTARNLTASMSAVWLGRPT